VELAALQSVFAGLILHNIGIKGRRDFELQLNDIEDRYQDKTKNM